ncbi:MAG TPA: DEAD/DEAH box helicase [Myxococcaceae bacterium]|nr:DEAD/DEAH box helicase [Myxococcaceae bacterium]
MDEDGTGRPPRRGRPGGRAGRGERGRGDRRERPGRRDSSDASLRVLTELSVLEKALSTGDFAKQRPPLEEIFRQLKPLRLSSLEGLDFNTRGRVLTTLLRVGRQKKPPEPPPVPSTAPVAESARPDEIPPTEPVSSEAAPAARAPSPEEEKLAAYGEVMFLLGSVWRAVGDEGRAGPAFAASGRSPEEREPPKPAAPPPSGDWREEAERLVSTQRGRDAAKLHEHHGSPAEAARLYEAGGDLKSALRSFLAAKDELSGRRLLRQLKPEQFLPVIEKAGAYQLLMEHYVEAGQFEEVAKLYERARQFDQAAIAWEKADKLGPARKAYERAKQSAEADRVRQLEVAKLVERGDRLGAAVLLVGAGKREQAVQTLSALPATKAFRFLQKLRLGDEALVLARNEIARAEAENRPAGRARWLERLGEASAAAEAWVRADRRDRALLIYEKAGEWQRAAPLAEALGQKDKAIELYRRVGDKTSADRVAAMPAPVVAAPSSGAPVALEGEGEEG